VKATLVNIVKIEIMKTAYELAMERLKKQDQEAGIESKPVTDAQKAQIDPLVKQAVAECAPLHDKFRAAHVDLLALFGADRVDRDAIERVRSENMRLADEATQRIARLLGDVADVLTAEQRKTLVARITQMHAEVHE
jgi:Spy/CpxP family protein refolding chaperone